MKRSLCASTVVGVLYANVFLAGQEPSFPLREGTAREAAALGAVLSPQPSRPRRPADDGPWASVRLVRAGSEVQMTTRLAPPVTRVFVTADDEGLTVLNLTDPALSRTPRRVLLNLARSHRDVLLAPDTLYQEPRVRLDRVGLFVRSRLVVERARLLEHIDRVALRELRFAGPGGSYWKRGLLIGLAGGALIAYHIGSACGPSAPPAECQFSGIVLMPLGAALGVAVGAGIGASVDRPSSDLIYREP